MANVPNFTGPSTGLETRPNSATLHRMQHSNPPSNSGALQPGIEPLRAEQALQMGEDPEACGDDGVVFTQEPSALAGSRAHPLIAGTKVHLTTFGCQMNKYDSEMVAGLLNEKGAGFVADEKLADLLIFNTCSVRAQAENRVFSRLGSLRARKRNNPGLLIAIMGCMAQKEGQAIASKYPFVDLIVGTRMLHQFSSLLERVREGARTPLVAVETSPEVSFGETVARRASQHQAFITVTRGCNKRCTYCVVPYTRGPEISRPVQEVVDEAKRLIDDGVVEFTLLGQTIDTYGYDLGRETANLPLLLKRLHALKGLERIRFITSHPEECRDELWRTMNDLGDKVMPFIHMPAQSGNNRILKRMARGYTRERYLEVVSSAREHCPGIEIVSDWIVGFSGETETEFEDSVTLMKEFRPQSSYIFKYSVREGTPAQNLKDDVSEEAKKDRLQRLMDLQEEISLEKYQESVGEVEKVLVEGPSKNNPERMTGRTRTNRLVHFPSGTESAGKFVDVRITAATAFSLRGERK